MTLFIQICSINSAKYYIPGETREIEALKRKALLNGAKIVVDIIMKFSKNECLVSKLREEFLNKLDITDLKINFYVLYNHFITNSI